MAFPLANIRPRRRNRVEVLAPNLGVYLDRPKLSVDRRAMVDCLNVRLMNGRVTNDGMGWTPFPDAANAVNLDNKRVMLIDQFFTRSGSQTLIFGNTTDLFRYNDPSEEVLYITPMYGDTFTASVTIGTKTVTGVGTAFDDNVKAGDFIHFGSFGENDPTETWLEIDSVTNATSLELVDNAPATHTTEAFTIRQTFTGDLLDFWETETFPDAQPDNEDLWFATNANEVVKWNGSDSTVEFLQASFLNPDPDVLGFVPRVMARYKNQMVYADITEAGERKLNVARNSDIASPAVVDGTGVSSEFNATDGIDQILELLPLADVLVAYGDRSINLMAFVGGTINYAVRTAIPGIGPLSGRSVMDFGDFHEFVGFDTGFTFDGVSVRENGQQVFREVLRTIERNRLDQAHVHIDEERGEVHWIVPLTTDGDPETGAPKRAYTEHYLEQVGDRNPTPMTIRDLPSTATGFYQRFDTLRFSDLPDPFDTYSFKFDDRFFAAAFPLNLFGTDDGDVFQLGGNTQDDAGSITCFARFGRTALLDGRRKGTVVRVEPFAAQVPAANYSLFVRLYVQEFAAGPDGAASDALAYDLKHASKRYVNPRLPGRYGSAEFFTMLDNNPWEIDGYAVETVELGER